MPVGTSSDLQWSVAAPFVKIERPRPERQDISEGLLLASLDEQLDDVYDHLQQIEKRRAAGAQTQVEWVAKLRAEISTATGNGWKLIAAGLTFSFIGTLLGFLR